MGANANCCEKDENIEQIIQERNEIFNYSPEDDKIPDDASFVTNHGGEYPIETDEPANFQYEAKYPNLVDGEKIIIKNLGPDKIYENDDNGEDMNAEMAFNEEQSMYDMNNMKKGELMQIKQLFDLCNRNGIPRPCDDFNPKGYTMFYSENDPYFYCPTDGLSHNQLKIYNKENMNYIQIYQGDLNAQGQRHGQGKCTTPYYVLIGQWKNDQFSGWGRESRCNGDVFEGRYENGLLNGKGIFLNEKKCKYIGDFKNTRRWGKGELTTEKIHYEGDFYDNKMHGIGKIKFLRDGVLYHGTFKNDELDGEGMFIFRNGDVYKGPVKFGKMHGMGMYKSKNGKVYNGQFNMGKKMNERLEMYRAWKSMNYGVDPNQVNQANNLNQNTGLNDGNDINVANSVQNNFPDNLRGNSIRSDYRNNGFNLGTNNLE
jgi:hypothetical protein